MARTAGHSSGCIEVICGCIVGGGSFGRDRKGTHCRGAEGAEGAEIEQEGKRLTSQLAPDSMMPGTAARCLFPLPSPRSLRLCGEFLSLVPLSRFRSFA